MKSSLCVRERAVAAVLGLLLASVCGACQASDPPSPAPAVVNGLGMELRLVPASRFTMGADREDRRNGPPHEVTLSRSFYLGATEVTVAQFATFVAATGYVTEAERDPAGGWAIDLSTGKAAQPGRCSWRDPGFPQAPDHPVLEVSWVDAEAFCDWLSATEAGRYRLPTEAEWESACRAGTATTWSFGDELADLRRHANVADESLRAVFRGATWSEGWDDGFAWTAPVGSFAPNALGLYDLHGNAWEWCADWHDDAYHRRSQAVDPEGPSAGRIRTIRGGGWYDPGARATAATRAWFTPVFRYCQLSGFRVARDVDTDRSS